MAQLLEPFGARVESEMRKRGMTPYKVEDASRGELSHMTVRRMLKGYPSSSDHIAEFAEALEDEPGARKELADDLLVLAGKRVRYASVRHPRAVAARPAAVRGR